MERRDPENSGVVTEMNRYLGNETSSTSPFETISYTWNKVYGTYSKYHPRLYSSLSVDNLTGKKITTTYSYDAFDYPIKIVTGVGDGSSSETVEITYSHKRNPSQYVLGLEATRKVTRKSANQSTWIDRTVTSYDESVLRPSSVVTFTGVDGGKKTGETRWTYDGYGNVLSEKSASYSSTVFVGDAYVYDDDGRFIKSKTDALGRTTNYSQYNSYGSPMIVEDAKGRSSYYSYDCFGNVTRKQYPDLSEETVTTAWGGEGLYTVTKSVTKQPTSKNHYDATGKEVRSEVQRFDGTWLITDTEYRADGLVNKVSLPFKGDSASGWALYDYDAYKRPIKIEEASGKVSTCAYSGLSMTTTGEGISSTKTSDQSGRVCGIQDPGGEITYSYRPDGQLDQVVAPESVLTSFEYDAYGRRIKIIDPSAGVRSTSYVNNNDGSSVVTETNPNGSVVTYLDVYGRKTKVERPGEYNTVYTYSDDNLLISEVSTNGTSTVYAYDNLDRVSSVRTTVPDGKWLLKEYTYGDGSVVNTVKYSSQDGEIATEVYSYSNGYKVQIALATGTVIWRLVEENNFGQPTRALTGNVDRFYSFDAHGLPAGRTLGTVQEFAYDFDPVTGNLNDRFDAVNSAGEVFGYDDLNRLDTVIPDACGDLSQYSVSYRPNGNISEKEGTGVFSYESNARPYQLTKIDLESDVNVPRVPQSISYTCYSRPSRIIENGVSCSFTYDGDGNRTKMLIANGATPILSRYYIGGQYEIDAKADGTVQRLYLGGDAYSAPMVYVKDDSSPWLLYNIGRDYLGSVTCITSVDGALVAEYSYDPWGRLRNPETLELYASGEEPELFLGRGFTGHEHLPYFGLINMNARLYDPFTGRFLSPDPYIQAPDFTQNYNRYSYALNNPLKFTDLNGEYIGWDDLAAALLGGVINWATSGCRLDWAGLAYFGIGVVEGLGCLYAPQALPAIYAASSSLNSVVNQGFDSNGKWVGHIDPMLVFWDGTKGFVSAYLGGKLNAALEPKLDKLISSYMPKVGLAPRRAIEQGLSLGISNFTVVTGFSLMETSGDVEASLKNGGLAALNGFAIGSLSGTFDGYNEARNRHEDPWTGRSKLKDNMPDGVTMPEGAYIPDEYVPNKNRRGSFGLADSDGNFIKELVRIDPATPPGRKGPNYPHYHDSRFSKGNNHKSLDRWPWIYKKPVK